MFTSLAKMHISSAYAKRQRIRGEKLLNDKREDSTEADCLGDTQLNPISSLSNTNHKIALGKKHLL